jgi:hypothetical protein
MVEYRLFLLTLITALVAASAAWLITADAIGNGYERTPFYAALSSGATFALLWYWLIERHRRFTVARGVVTGALVGLLSHPLFWYLFLLDSWLRYQLYGQPISSLGEPPMNPLDALAAALIYTLWSWFLVGWITAVVGAVTGGITTGLIARSRGEQR